MDLGRVGYSFCLICKAMLLLLLGSEDAPEQPHLILFRRQNAIHFDAMFIADEIAFLYF